MADLISAGVSVNVIDESIFIPAESTTLPLVIIATADEKRSGVDNTLNASGTFESGVVRTITSVRQSIDLFGIPRFLEDASGNPHHGDARNEYGLLTLNKFLGVASRAYVLRADVNLDDDIDSLRSLWDSRSVTAGNALESLINQFIANYNTINNLTPSDAGYKLTITGTELKSLAREATTPLFESYSFKNVDDNFLPNQSGSPLSIYGNGYDQNPTDTFIGFDAIVDDLVANSNASTVPGLEDEFTAIDAESLFIAAATDFKYTIEFRDDTSLGANDAARRVNIVTALQAVINGTDIIRSENFEYNLIVCPGYPEVADELLALCTEIKEEAFVIGDTPMNLTPEDLVNIWSNSVAKRSSRNIAYYYPHTLVSNIDGKDVLGASSGAALRAIGYSDSVSELWFAPAGVRRGVLSDVSDIGYVSGSLGGPTQFIQLYPNQGTRDDMYKYFTNLNPIVFFPGRGILVWGQKTTQGFASALDRVNVVRLVGYIRRSLRKALLSFVFEPNDSLTRASVKAVCDGFLGDLIIRRGLADFVVICDESNNTPFILDNSTLKVDIAIKPVKAAEFIVVDLIIASQGAAL